MLFFLLDSDNTDKYLESEAERGVVVVQLVVLVWGFFVLFLNWPVTAFASQMANYS